MKVKIKIVFMLMVAISIKTFSQNTISFDSREIDSYRIDREIYNFYWYKNHINKNNGLHLKEFKKEDTIPYFVDDREYKGLRNYGIKHINLGKTENILVENFKMFYLNYCCPIKLKNR